MVDMAASKASATAKIQKEGQALTLVSYSPGVYDPGTGATVQTTSESVRHGLLWDLGDSGAYYRGKLIELSDKKLMMDAEGQVNLKDHVIVDGTEYKIVSIGGLNPSGTRIFFDLHLRA